MVLFFVIANRIPWQARHATVDSSANFRQPSAATPGSHTKGAPFRNNHHIVLNFNKKGWNSICQCTHMRNRNNPGNKCRYIWHKNCRSFCPPKWNPSADGGVQTDYMVLTNGFVVIKKHAATGAACRHNKRCADLGSRTSKWNLLPCCRIFIFLSVPKRTGSSLYKKAGIKKSCRWQAPALPSAGDGCR